MEIPDDDNDSIEYYKEITDIVVDINDFLVIANMKHGAIHMAKNGGLTMMLSSAVMEEKFLLKKFFKSIEVVAPRALQKGEVFTFNLFSDWYELNLRSQELKLPLQQLK